MRAARIRAREVHSMVVSKPVRQVRSDRIRSTDPSDHMFMLRGVLETFAILYGCVIAQTALSRLKGIWTR